MKKCTKCESSKELSEFWKRKAHKDGSSNICKKCESDVAIKYIHSKSGLISRIFSQQKSSSKHRKHHMPLYTKKQLEEWLLNSDIFNGLYDLWVNSDYLKSERPSIDRLDDNDGYSFDNIQIVTWGENKQKGHDDMRSAKLIHGHNPQKAVIRLSSNGDFIDEFVSACEADRACGVDQSNISECCRGKRNKAGGFLWKFK